MLPPLGLIFSLNWWTGVGRYLTLSSSGLHRGVRTAQCQQQPASCPQLLLSENQDVCAPLDSSSIFWATEVPCRGWEFTSESQSARWEYRWPGRWRSWGPEREHLGNTGPSSDSQLGGFPVLGSGRRDYRPQATMPGRLRWVSRFFLEPKTELSSWLRSPLSPWTTQSQTAFH